MGKIQKEKNKIGNKKNFFFILKGVENIYGKIGAIKPLNTISKNKRLSNARGVYSLWLYNDVPNKNFYKLGYGIKCKNKMISVVLSYPFTKEGVKKYNKKLFKILEKIKKEEMEKVITLIQLFESNNLSEIEKIIIKILKKDIDLKTIICVLQILKYTFGKSEKSIQKEFDKISDKDKNKLNEVGITKNNAYLFLVFFHDFFKIVSMLKLKNIKEIRRLFISFLNVNIIFFDKVEFPLKTNKDTDIDQVFFEV